MPETSNAQMYAQIQEMERCKNDPVYLYNTYIKQDTHAKITMEGYNKAVNLFMSKNFIRKHNLQVTLIQE